jgi:hypothetical protein
MSSKSHCLSDKYRPFHTRIAATAANKQLSAHPHDATKTISGQFQSGTGRREIAIFDL